MFSILGLVTALQTLGISQGLRLGEVSFVLGMDDFWKELACDWRVENFIPHSDFTAGRGAGGQINRFWL